MPKGDLLEQSIWQKLSVLRTSLRRRLTMEALAWLVVALVALVFITLGFDYPLRLDRPLRGLIMGLCLLGVVWVLWQNLVRPLLVPMPVDDLALLVESHYAELDDRLIASVEFSRADLSGEDAVTRAMVERTGAQANDIARPLNFLGLVERSNLRRAMGAAACAAMLLGGFTIWKSDVMSLWFQRNVTIWSDAQWPQKTELRVEGGPDFTVVRGRNLRIAVTVMPGKEAPKYVTFHAKYPSINDVTEDRIDQTETQNGAYVKTYTNVNEPFKFWVTGGDDSRDENRPHNVTVLDPPVLRDMKFTVRFPQYMGQDRPRTFDGSLGTINVPAGSTVLIDGRSTKDLITSPNARGEAGAAMFLDAAAVAADQGELSIQNDSSGRPRRVVGRVVLKAAATEAGKGRRVLARQLRIALTDTDGIHEAVAGQFLIQVLPDQAPKITARKTGVGGSVTTRASIPLLLHAGDDYGVGGLKTQIRILPAKGKPIVEKVVLPEAGQKELRMRHELELRKRFEPKTIIQISVQAEDTLPAEMGGPNVGVSGVLDFRVVTDDELMAELVRRQKELRMEFVQTIAAQAGARAKSLSAQQSAEAEGLKDAGDRSLELPAADLKASAGLQMAVASECAKAAMTLQEIFDELTNNKLGSPEALRELKDDVIQPLSDMAAPIQELVESLRKAQEVTDAAAMAEQARLAAATQAGLLKKLTEIRDRMHKIETRQELAYKLEKLINIWNRVVEGAEKESDTEVGDLLGPGKKPKDKKQP